ncbi:MAG: hypothetical protein Q7R95_00510 [bacterium]|nr:hypothetical protein [bacterium]
MKNNKSKIITIILIGMTIILMIAIFYIGLQLTNSNVQQAPIALKKTKAASTTYNKLVAINQNPLRSPTIVPSEIPLISITITPIPTEIILAQAALYTPYVSPSITQQAVISPSLSFSPTIQISNTAGVISVSSIITKTSTLPQTGMITNSLIMFAVASVFVFLSFLF